MATVVSEHFRINIYFSKIVVNFLELSRKHESTASKMNTIKNREEMEN